MGFICVIFQNGFFVNLKTKSKIEKTKEKARKQIVFISFLALNLCENPRKLKFAKRLTNENPMHIIPMVRQNCEYAHKKAKKYQPFGATWFSGALEHSELQER